MQLKWNDNDIIIINNIIVIVTVYQKVSRKISIWPVEENKDNLKRSLTYSV